MVKLPVSVKEFMADPDMSITTSPFAPGKMIVKRASFKKGEVPAHLTPFLIKPGQCKGLKGTTIHNGKLVPKTAACVARGRKK